MSDVFEFKCFPVEGPLPKGPLWLYFKQHDRWILCHKWKNATGDNNDYREFFEVDNLGRSRLTKEKPTHYAFKMPRPVDSTQD